MQNLKEYNKSEISETERINKIKVLLIDEDDNMVYLMRNLSRTEKYKIIHAEDGKTGAGLAAEYCPEIIVMDTRLRDTQGIEVIRRLREWYAGPILVVSEDEYYLSKVRALDAGADDYLTKPFFEEELLSRMRALLRRCTCRHKQVYRVKGLQIDFEKRQVSKYGNPVHLPPVEYRILEYLAANAGKVVTYKMLLEKMWGPYAIDDNKILRVNMTNIRRKIEDTPAQPKYLFTEPRVGYRMLESS